MEHGHTVEHGEPRRASSTHDEPVLRLPSIRLERPALINGFNPPGGGGEARFTHGPSTDEVARVGCTQIFETPPFSAPAALTPPGAGPSPVAAATGRALVREHSADAHAAVMQHAASDSLEVSALVATGPVAPIIPTPAHDDHHLPVAPLTPLPPVPEPPADFQVESPSPVRQSRRVPVSFAVTAYASMAAGLTAAIWYAANA